MKLQPIKKIKALVNVLKGKSGTKPAVWTWLAIPIGLAAIGLGIAFHVCVLPLSAAFCAVGLLSTSVSAATNASGSISNHKHFSEITTLSKKNIALEQENLEMQQQLIASLEGRQETPQEQERVSPDNTDTQNSPKTRKLTALFNVLKGKSGPRAKAWTRFAIAAEVAAIGVGVSIAVGVLPLSLSTIFFTVSLVTTGVSSAANGAGSVSNHKHFAQITELQRKNATWLEGSADSKRKLLALLKTQKGIIKASAPGPG